MKLYVYEKFKYTLEHKKFFWITLNKDLFYGMHYRI